MKERKKIRVALVGTDSLRGKELKNVLSKRPFPLKDIDFFDPDVEEEYSKLTEFRGEPKVIHYLDKIFFKEMVNSIMMKRLFSMMLVMFSI